MEQHVEVRKSIGDYIVPVVLPVYLLIVLIVLSPRLLLNWVLIKVSPDLRIYKNDKLVAERSFRASIRIPRGHGRWYKETCNIPKGSLWASRTDYVPYFPSIELRPVDVEGFVNNVLSEHAKEFHYFKLCELRISPLNLVGGKMKKISEKTPNQAL